jgi:hypothetical protein
MVRRNTKRERVRRTNNILAIFLVGLVLGCMAIMIQVRINAVKSKIALYEKKEILLEEQLKEQEERKAALDAREIHVKTDEYKIEVAKEKLGLVFPDEILIKPSE